MRKCCGRPSSEAKLELERSAKTFAETGKHAEAAEALRKRVRLSPENPMVWNDLGVQSMAAGLPEAAYEAFQRAHQALPDYPLALYNLGAFAMVCCVLGQGVQDSPVERTQSLAQEAIRYLTRSLDREPSLTQAHVLLSAAYGVIGDEVRAQFHRQQAAAPDSNAFATTGRTWGSAPGMVWKPPVQREFAFVMSSGRVIHLRSV